MVEDASQLKKMEESVEESESSPFITASIDGKQPGTSQLDDNGKGLGNYSSLQGLGERFQRLLLLLVAAAVLLTAMSCFACLLAPGSKTQG